MDEHVVVVAASPAELRAGAMVSVEIELVDEIPSHNTGNVAFGRRVTSPHGDAIACVTIEDGRVRVRRGRHELSTREEDRILRVTERARAQCAAMAKAA